jgi:perosamine synthetase
MKLAINGGKPVRDYPFPDQSAIGENEREAVNNFLSKNPLLSNYRGNWIKEFWGGTEVNKFERVWGEYFQTDYNLAVNSCTSALHIACGAIGLQPGDEVIVTPWSMSCSATAPLLYKAVPVFADIEHDHFCISYDSIVEKITSKTKAIIAVSLFGCPIDPRIYQLAKEKSIYLIEDAAQSPGAGYWQEDKQLQLIGGIADITCFSFTQGKHMTCGEGGMISTNNYHLAMKCALLRNHSESVISAMPNDVVSSLQLPMNFIQLPGFNMRMTEINAVIMYEQLMSLDWFIAYRQQNVRDIYHAVQDIPFITAAPERPNTKDVCYVQPFFFDEQKAGIDRHTFIEAVKAELPVGEKRRPDRPMIGEGYIKPLYSMPIFGKPVDMLPTAYNLWKSEFFLTMYHNLNLINADIITIGNAFSKVAENISELKYPRHEKNYYKGAWK